MPRNNDQNVEQEALVAKHQNKTNSDMTSSYLLELLDDVLYVIFSKCDIKSLGRLCQTCHRLNFLLQSDCVWLKHSKKLSLIKADDFVQDVFSEDKSLKEDCRISHNWINKQYKEKTLIRYNPKQIPWLQYINQTLWISIKDTIKCYNIRQNGDIHERRERHLKQNQHTTSDVSRFVVKDRVAVSGYRDGSVGVYDVATGHQITHYNKVHGIDTQAVDIHGSCIVTGSRDQTVKILHITDDYSSSNQADPVRTTLDVRDRVWCLSIAPNGRSFAVGTAGVFNAPLSVWDIECGESIFIQDQYKIGAGVLDIRYETDTTFLTCGYDSMLRLWDVRCGQCVLEWEDPHDTSLYCVQSDRDITMVTGTARYGMIRLWDKRQTQPVQLYYLPKGQRSSPVYSLGFDSSHLYTALDVNLVMADFSVLNT